MKKYFFVCRFRADESCEWREGSLGAVGRSEERARLAVHKRWHRIFHEGQLRTDQCTYVGPRDWRELLTEGHGLSLAAA